MRITEDGPRMGRWKEDEGHLWEPTPSVTPTPGIQSILPVMAVLGVKTQSFFQTMAQLPLLVPQPFSRAPPSYPASKELTLALR